MKALKWIAVVFIAVYAMTTVVGGTLNPSFDPQDCIEEGSNITVDCTLEDASGFGGTRWSGSTSIFNCPHMQASHNNSVYLSHYYDCTSSGPQCNCSRVPCNSRVFGQLKWCSGGVRGTLYTSTLTIQSVTLLMDGGDIECYHQLTPMPTASLTLKVEGIITEVTMYHVWAKEEEFQGYIAKYPSNA